MDRSKINIENQSKEQYLSNKKAEVEAEAEKN